jgi:hypothetical protein
MAIERDAHGSQGQTPKDQGGALRFGAGTTARATTHPFPQSSFPRARICDALWIYRKQQPQEQVTPTQKSLFTRNAKASKLTVNEFLRRAAEVYNPSDDDEAL